jgi:hypothetical protein
MSNLKEEYEAEEIERIARWLKTQVDEYRCTYIPSLPLHELLAFIYPARIGELGDLLESHNSDWFNDGDGLIKATYNGSDLVVDVLPILKKLKIDPRTITKEYRGEETK